MQLQQLASGAFHECANTVLLWSQIASSKNGTAYKRWFLQDVPPDEKTKEVYDAEITMEIQWVPYDFEDAKQ